MRHAWTRAAGPHLLLSCLALSACPGGQPVVTPSGPHPRVVTASPALAEAVCAIGAEELLVGVSRFCTVPEQLGRLPRIGGILDPNLEAIDALQPDVILWQGQVDSLAELVARRPYRLESYRLESIADVLAGLRRLGSTLGRSVEAEREVARLEGALAAARAAAPAPRPRALIVFDRSPGELHQLPSAARGTFLSELVEAAGADNCLVDVAPGAWPLLTAEVPLGADPDLILELSARAPDAERARALVEDWRRAFPELRAVVQGRVEVVAGEELLIPGPRLDQTLRKLQAAVRGQARPTGGARD